MRICGAGGLPFPIEQPNAIKMGKGSLLEMIPICRGKPRLKRKPTFHYVRYRPSNTGPVVAWGSVGNKKFSYDIWGDNGQVAFTNESFIPISGRNQHQ